MIEVSRYQKSDFEVLLMLHESQESILTNQLQPDHLPEVGFYAYNSAIPIAMGFLRKVEGGYGMIDTLVTNGDLPSETRHLGIQLVVDTIIEAAKTLKLKGIISLSSDTGVINRAISIGFHVVPQTAIALPIKE